MPPTAAVPVQWAEVMAGLTGLRLAIHDELLRCGALDYAHLTIAVGQGDGMPGTPESAHEQIKQAVAWLAQHRLLVVEEGMWRAVMPALARVQFEMNGLAAVAEPAKAKIQPAKEPPTRVQTQAVHDHQREFFLNEGYREANGATGY